MENNTTLTGFALLRAPFLPHQINKLPKPTKQQTDEVKADFKAGIRCTVCGAWHHPKVVHLDYVGHAALTDRLLSVDPAWQWKPLAYSDEGLPRFDETGGLWIELTVLGVTRLGYGNAPKDQRTNEEPGKREKEVIGDALRNAGMRFGVALDLWHKGQLHLDADEPPAAPQAPVDPQAPDADGVVPPPPPPREEVIEPPAELLAQAMAAAEKGNGAYSDFWKATGQQNRKLIGASRHADFKAMAETTPVSPHA